MGRFATSTLWAICLASLPACGGSERDPPAAAEGAATSPPAETLWFEEIAAASGLDFVHVAYHVQRFWMPEISPGGVAFLDYDGDGWLDVYCVQSGDPAGDAANQETDRLYRNQRDGTFRDVSSEAGIAEKGYGHGCATGDYDSDGDVDLYVTNLRGNTFYRNRGNGTFEDVTEETGTRLGKWSASCAFTDYDEDGDLDLFVVNNLSWTPEVELECRSAQAERDYCLPTNYNLPSQDTLYRNEGGGKFTDVTRESGIDTATGIGLGVAIADYDADGDVDLFVANDSMPNVLWINDGRGGFKNKALLLGCAVNENGAPEASMGAQAFDLENDGDWDLFSTHLRGEKNTLYLNTRGAFADRSSSLGMMAANRAFTGWGLGFVDFDQDGRLDLFVANGRVGLWKPHYREDSPYAEPNHVFRGEEGGRFTQIDGGIGGLIGSSRGAAFGDYDNDGDVDVVYMDRHEPVRLLRNVALKRGTWIGLRLLNRHGSDALGATARIQTPAGFQYRLCHTAYSYCAANDPRVHFGLGAADATSSVRVTWPDREEEDFGPLPAGQYHTLRQGSGKPAAK
ncbi:MAG: CRTAC1 family protein [Planctomycetota bacterium]